MGLPDEFLQENKGVIPPIFRFFLFCIIFWKITQGNPPLHKEGGCLCHRAPQGRRRKRTTSCMPRASDEESSAGILRCDATFVPDHKSRSPLVVYGKNGGGETLQISRVFSFFFFALYFGELHKGTPHYTRRGDGIS